MKKLFNFIVNTFNDLVSPKIERDMPEPTIFNTITHNGRFKNKYGVIIGEGINRTVMP